MVTSGGSKSGGCVCHYFYGLISSAGSCTIKIFYTLAEVVLSCGSNSEVFFKETRFNVGPFTLGGDVIVDVVSTATV